MAQVHVWHIHTQWLTTVRDKVNINKVKISTKHDCIH